MLKTWTVFWLAMLIIALTITIVDMLNFKVMIYANFREPTFYFLDV